MSYCSITSDGWNCLSKNSRTYNWPVPYMLRCWGSLWRSSRLSRSRCSHFPFPGKCLFPSMKKEFIRFDLLCEYYLRIESNIQFLIMKINQQEGEVEKCRTCALVFHKNCFKKLASCPCGARFKKEETKRSSSESIRSVDSNLVSLAGTAEPSSGILAGLFSKVMPARSQISRKREAEGVGNVIPMGSLPSTSLEFWFRWMFDQILYTSFAKTLCI